MICEVYEHPRYFSLSGECVTSSMSSITASELDRLDGICPGCQSLHSSIVLLKSYVFYFHAVRKLASLYIPFMTTLINYIILVTG